MSVQQQVQQQLHAAAELLQLFVVYDCMSWALNHGTSSYA